MPIFTSYEVSLFFRLVVAHLLIESALQPTSWLSHKWTNKHRSRYLYFHSLLAGLFTYVLAGEWESFWIIVAVGVTHALIDWIHISYGKQADLRTLFLDQFLHTVVLVAAWCWLTKNWSSLYNLIGSALANKQVVAIATGYFMCITPIGYVIGVATKRWQDELAALPNASDTLVDAGRWIGITERVLIFTFVLLKQYEAIGFLIAAKSILRFKESERAQKQSEYVLVGTLLSYSLAILTGILIQLMIE